MPVGGEHKMLLGLEVPTDLIHGVWWKENASIVPERWGQLFLVKAIGSPLWGESIFLKETKRWRVLQMHTHWIGEPKAEDEINEGVETETSYKSKERSMKSWVGPKWSRTRCIWPWEALWSHKKGKTQFCPWRPLNLAMGKNACLCEDIISICSSTYTLATCKGKLDGMEQTSPPVQMCPNLKPDFCPHTQASCNSLTSLSLTTQPSNYFHGKYLWVTSLLLGCKLCELGPQFSCWCTSCSSLQRA